MTYNIIWYTRFNIINEIQYRVTNKIQYSITYKIQYSIMVTIRLLRCITRIFDILTCRLHLSNLLGEIFDQHNFAKTHTGSQLSFCHLHEQTQ